MSFDVDHVLLLSELTGSRSADGRRIDDVLAEPIGAVWPVRGVIADGRAVGVRWTAHGLATGDPIDPAGLVALDRDVLDRQVVDVHGRRIVRVGDVAIAEVDDALSAVALEVGLRPVLRRVGLGALVRAEPDLMRLAHVEPTGSCLVAHVDRVHLDAVETHHLARLIRRLPHRMKDDVLERLPPERRHAVRAHITSHPHRPRLRRFRPSRHA